MHQSAIVTEWFHRTGVCVLGFPAAYSPDLNPIENLWSITATQVNMHQCATEESLSDVVLKVWGEINTEIHQKLAIVPVVLDGPARALPPAADTEEHPVNDAALRSDWDSPLTGSVAISLADPPSSALLLPMDGSSALCLTGWSVGDIRGLAIDFEGLRRCAEWAGKAAAGRRECGTMASETARWSETAFSVTDEDASPRSPASRYAGSSYAESPRR
jgi:hypothetical protein